jgi:hypothetical protein
MNAIEPNTRQEAYESGYNAACVRQPVKEVIEEAAERGCSFGPAEMEAMIEGHAAGTEDLEQYLRDVAAGVNQPYAV